MRKLISIVVLAVYSIAIAHNIIPHHHHSQFDHAKHLCEDDSHNGHHEEIEGTCCVNHSHNDHTHDHCHFNEESILTKSVNLSDLFVPSTGIKFVALKKDKQSVSNCYIYIQIPDPHCRDVHLRGPPSFS